MSETSENKHAKKNKEFSLGKEIFEWFYTIIIALAVAFAIKTFVFDIVEVEGPSMYPTLVDGDRLIVTKLGYKPQKGDIIILDSAYKKRADYYEENSDGDDVNWFYKATNYHSLPDDLKIKYYVKRVIATEGETVDLRDGDVYVNGKLLEEPYYDEVTSILDPTTEFPLTVDEGCIFVMGDNRPRSLDSRDSSLGQVPVEAVTGHSVFRIWPFNAIGSTK